MHSEILLSYKVQRIPENLGKRLDLEIDMLSEMHPIQKEKTPIFSFICLSIPLIFICVHKICVCITHVRSM